MRISVFSGKVRVDLFVVRTRGVAEVHLAKVLLKAFPRCLLFSRSAARQRTLPRVSTTILLFKGIGEPVCWRRSSCFCLALNHGVDCVTQFKDQRLTHAFPPLPTRLSEL
jgi:hypothetical protein